MTKINKILASVLVITILCLIFLGVEYFSLKKKNDTLERINGTFAIITKKKWEINSTIPIGYRCTKVVFNSSDKDGIAVFYDTSNCDKNNSLEREEIKYYKNIFGKLESSTQW